MKQVGRQRVAVGPVTYGTVNKQLEHWVDTCVRGRVRLMLAFGREIRLTFDVVAHCLCGWE